MWNRTILVVKTVDVLHRGMWNRTILVERTVDVLHRGHVELNYDRSEDSRCSTQGGMWNKTIVVRTVDILHRGHVELNHLPSTQETGPWQSQITFLMVTKVHRHHTIQTLGRVHAKLHSCDFTLAIFSVKTRTKPHGLSPRANYTDRATVACRRSWCQLLRMEGATRGQFSQLHDLYSAKQRDNLD
jgi:hypothetical protein